MSGNYKVPMICFFLILFPLIAFWQLNRSDFITFDDPYYITENAHIHQGVTAETIRWAFTTTREANWHPLTWISHELDIQLFGLKPGWHHLTNLLFHIANTLLLFFVLQRMTKAPWQSGFVAALFAIHPLHVESVAWVAERKDVLSTFFWMLTVGAYAFYVERPRLQRYLAVLTFFALGLMAKPMLVTLPFVLLLLDYWPLQRFEQKGSVFPVQPEADKPAANQKRKKSKKEPARQDIAHEPKPAELKAGWTLIRPLLWEKLPLLILTALSCIVTFIAQQRGGAVRSLEALSPGVRIANSSVSYIVYIAKTIWPTRLAVYYPHPGSWPIWEVAGAVLLLLLITSFVIWKAKRYPFLPVGWLWFAGTLVPVIGLVQIGSQAMADRYTYVPLIGLFIMIAWGIPELLKENPYRKAILSVASAVVLLCLFVLTMTQVGYWHDSFTLYDHALEVTVPNDLIYTNLGVAHEKIGNHQQALADFERAIEYSPNCEQAYDNRGLLRGNLGDHRQAIEDFKKAIEIKPDYSEAWYNLGTAYSILGNHAQAIEAYNRALEFDPGYIKVYYDRSYSYAKIGNRSQAIEDLKIAARFDDESAKATLRNLGMSW